MKIKDNVSETPQYDITPMKRKISHDPVDLLTYNKTDNNHPDVLLHGKIQRAIDEASDENYIENDKPGVPYDLKEDGTGKLDSSESSSQFELEAVEKKISDNESTKKSDISNISSPAAEENNEELGNNMVNTPNPPKNSVIIL